MEAAEKTNVRFMVERRGPLRLAPRGEDTPQSDLVVRTDYQRLNVRQFSSQGWQVIPSLQPQSGSMTIVPYELAESARQKFDRLAKQWQRETALLSDLDAMVGHPAYQKVIGMGADAVPMLLEEMQRGPNHWYAALHFITEAEPVSPEDFGDVEAIRHAWLRWGEESGYLNP